MEVSGLGFIGDRVFDEAEESFRQEFRTWLVEHPPPRAPLGIDREYVSVYRAWQRLLAEAGYGALHWPVEHGGAGLPVGHQIVQLEELSSFGVDHAILLNALHMVAPLLIARGSDEQRAAHLPHILRGEEVWSQMLSEPGAGSDLAAVSTRGEVDGDELVLDGQKVWTTWGHFADFGLCLCRTGPGLPPSRALSLVIVDMRTPGIDVRPLRQMHGGQDFNEVFLERVRVPLSNVVGPVGEGWQGLKVLLTAERTGLGFTGYVSLVAATKDLMGRMGRVDGHLREQAVRLWSQVALHRLTSLRAANLIARAMDGLGPASVGKLQFSQNYRLLGETRLMALGPQGSAWDEGATAADEDVHFFLLGPGATIGGGTSEVQRNAVAEAGLGLPRA